MSSVAATRDRTDIDEALLYLATGAALGAALLAAGWGSGSARVGGVGAALAIAGVWTSWRTRDWSPNRRALIGILGGVLAASALQALISWEMEQEVGMIYQAKGDIGLSLALRMAVLLLALSFLLIRREMLPFALVPGVTLFGLAGGRGIEGVAFGCFLVFLPAALAALGQAMMLSGIPARWRTLGAVPDMSSWRRRHWSLLGTLIAVILGLGTLIYIPVLTYGTQYYWPLAMMSLGGGRFGLAEGRRSVEAARTYAVGQGPIAPAATPVLSFTGDPAPLWRGEVFDSYTGSAWRSSDEEPTPVRIIRGEVDVQRFLPPASPRALATHELRVEQDMPLIIYGAGQVEQAVVPRLLAVLIPRGLFLDKFGCVSAPGATLPAGTRYDVTSDTLAYTAGSRDSRVESSSGGLRLTDSHLPRSLGEGGSPPRLSTLEAAADASLRIPLSSRRVADLARRLTTNATSIDAKVQALVSYLQRDCIYTLNAPAVPHGEDAADFFLFTSKRGYCDLFATAFVVMARAAGIPARFVTGFAGGEYDAETHRYVLRESDRHAWAEIYEPPLGWVSVDATPGGGPVTLSPLAQAIAAAQVFLRSYPMVDLGLGAIIVAALLAAIVLLVRRRASLAQLALDRNDPRAIVVRAYVRLTRALARRGRPRRPDQTPSEYLAAISVREKLAAARRSHRLPEAVLPPVRALTDLFLLARYSPHPVTGETASLALTHLAQAADALRRPRRHR